MNLVLTDSRESSFYSMRIYNGIIFHAIIKSRVTISIELMEEGYRFLRDNGGGKFYNIFEFERFSDVEPEVRAWAARNSGNKFTLADAIVINSLPHKILADFYMRFNRPAKPTRIFSDFDKAVLWIETLIREAGPDET